MRTSRTGRNRKPRAYRCKATITYNTLGFAHYLQTRTKELGRTPTSAEMMKDLKIAESSLRRNFYNCVKLGIIVPVPVIYELGEYPKKSEVNLRMTGASRNTALFYIGKKIYDHYLKD